jgi:hypothetical protein
MLCTFCIQLCETTFRTVEDMDARGIPNKHVDDVPGQTAQQLLEGAGLGCHLCGTFLGKAPDDYRTGVQNNSLNPPHFQDGFVNCYSIFVMTNLQKEFDATVDRRIFIYLSYGPKAMGDAPPGRPARGEQEMKVVQGFMILAAKSRKLIIHDPYTTWLIFS